MRKLIFPFPSTLITHLTISFFRYSESIIAFHLEIVVIEYRNPSYFKRKCPLWIRTSLSKSYPPIIKYVVLPTFLNYCEIFFIFSRYISFIFHETSKKSYSVHMLLINQRGLYEALSKNYVSELPINEEYWAYWTNIYIPWNIPII